jgi:ABC-type multidrug transport system permease subunit
LRQINAIWALAAHDLLMWRRMPLAAACALIPPLGMGLLIIVLTLTVTRQPVALVVQSHGPNTDRMAKLIRSDEDAYMLTETNSTQAKAMLEGQQVAAIVTIPAGFDRAVNANAGTLDLTLNNVDVDFSDDIRRSVERSAGEFDGLQLGREAVADSSSGAGEPAADQPAGTDADDAPTADGKADDATAAVDAVAEVRNAYNIGITEHDLRVTNVDFLHYQVVPVLILLVLSVGLMGTAMLCSADGERGTARLLILAPVSARALVAGRLLGGVITSLAALILALALCIVAHAISPPAGHWPALIALFGCTAVCASGLGAVLGSLMRGSGNIAMASSILASYLFFLGGGFTTIAFLPRWLQDISLFNPIRYAIDGMRQALFYPDLRGLGTDLAVLTGTAVCAVMVGSVSVVRAWRN